MKNRALVDGFVQYKRHSNQDRIDVDAHSLAVVGYFPAFFVMHHKLALEAAALRQQRAVFKRKQMRQLIRRMKADNAS